MRKFKSVEELINTLKPDYPVYCIRPDSIKKSVDFFKNKFPGTVLYAVKTNPHEKVLKSIISNGNAINLYIKINELSEIESALKILSELKKFLPSIFKLSIIFFA